MVLQLDISFNFIIQLFYQSSIQYIKGCLLFQLINIDNNEIDNNNNNYQELVDLIQEMTTAIQYMMMIMKAEKFKLEYILEIVQILNNSYLSAKDIVSILQEIFRNEKSGKILLAVNVLQYLVKNCNRNFHQAANRQSFQLSVLGLLKRQRGKSNILKDMRSNTQNWSRIQAKTLYLVQLWYDAFILEESKYPHIINVYKVLRKQNIVFPPRNTNEKNLMVVKTESPIFDNIENIAQTDKVKFNKRLLAMGMPTIKDDRSYIQQKERQPVSKTYWIDLDEISEKIAIIKSQEYEGDNVLAVIEKLKKDLEFGKIRPEYQKFWKEIKQAAELAINQWEQKHSELVKKQQENFSAMKLGKLGMGQKQSNQEEVVAKQIPVKKQQKEQKPQTNLIDTWDLLGDPQPEPPKKQQQSEYKQQINLLDL